MRMAYRRLSAPSPKRSRAFSMIEMLIVIAVIGIMSALVISAFSNAAADTRRVVARQQQAAVQNAVNAWINATSQEHGLAEARRQYNLAATSKGRLSKVQKYLDKSSVDHFLSPSNTVNENEVRSAALRKLGQHLYLGAWKSDSYPRVELLPPPQS